MCPKHLGIKFSLLLALVWLLSSFLITFALSNHLKHQAERAVKERAEILISTMQAARNYTRNQIRTILKYDSDLGGSFIKESVPNFAVRVIFRDFQKQNPEFQDFLYKEAALNPTNPYNRADEFESQIFNQLRQHTIADPETLAGYRTLEGEKLFYLARARIMDDASCLECHGNPKDAPQSLIDIYGDKNGFGWKLNDVVAVQMVYMPSDTVFDRGHQNLMMVTKTLFSIFGALFLVINLLLWRTVNHPLQILTKTANKISGYTTIQKQSIQIQDRELAALTIRQDEPGQLARAFQYMIHVLNRREQDLQREVGERTASLAQEMQDRQTAQDALKTYSQAINHDLRNLVTGVSSLVQGILFCNSEVSQSTGKSDAKEPPTIIEIESKALELIRKSCDRQLSLMDSLMEIHTSDIWSVTLQPKRINLRSLTEELQIAYEAKLLSSAATLENRIPADLPTIQADPIQIQRIFENLIDNALKYNPDGVSIILNATLLDSKVPIFRCTFSDDGIGIPPGKSQELFNVYARGHANCRVTGHGLGLYICRKIVEAHGGSIGVETSASGGAEFWFTLPLQRKVSELGA